MATLRLRREGLEWRRVDDEVIALDLESARYLGTNATGALLWSELAAGTTQEALAAKLAAAENIDPARAAADVDAFVSDLIARGLLERT